MSTIKYRKEFIIKHKVFKEEDILLLARTINEQYKEGDYTKRFTLQFDDKSEVRGDDLDVFATEAFKRRQCETIRFEYAAKGYDKQITIKLYNKAISILDSQLEVESTDQVWYESMLKRLETILDDAEKQHWVGQFTVPLSIVLSIIEAALLSVAINKLLPELSQNSLSSLIAMSIVLICFLNLFLSLRLRKAYPSIEFAFGPMHRNTSFRLKQVIGILIPLVVDVVFFVLGLIIK